MRVPGALDGFELSAEDINGIIMEARVKAGWVKAEDLVPKAAEPAAEAAQG